MVVAVLTFVVQGAIDYYVISAEWNRYIILDYCKQNSMAVLDGIVCCHPDRFVCRDDVLPRGFHDFAQLDQFFDS